MTKLNKKYLKQLDYFKLSVYITEYRESLSLMTNGELKEAKKIYNRLLRYQARIAKKERIETLTQMNNRKLDKHIK